MKKLKVLAISILLLLVGLLAENAEAPTDLQREHPEAE